MRIYHFFGLLVLGTLAACSQSEQPAAKGTNQPMADMKIDLKGIYPGMTKVEIDKTLGSQECSEREHFLRDTEAKMASAENVIALAEKTESPPNELPPPEEVTRARKILQNKNSHMLRSKFDTEMFDTICIINETAGITFANHPSVVQIGLKNGRVRHVVFSVMNSNEKEILRGLALKYNLIDPNDEAQLMQLGLSMSQGFVDGRDNTLFMLKSSAFVGATELIMMEADFKMAFFNFWTEVQKTKTGVKDM